MTPTDGTARDATGPREPRPGAGDTSPGAVWDRRYAEVEWSREPDTALVELVGPLSPGRALDLGCGPGRNAVWLARQGWTVTGVDASAVALAQAAERARDAGVSLDLVQADVLTYVPPARSDDLVVVAKLHFSPEERVGFFSRAEASLAPGGHLYVAGHHLESLGRVGPRDPQRLYTEELLADLLAPLAARVWRRERTPNGAEGPVVEVVAWGTAPSGEENGP